MTKRPARPPLIRSLLMAAGIGLIVVTPVAALLPGPAGIFTFAGGAGLVLQNSSWARRRFALAKRRFPRTGRLVDRGLRRQSARRRRERDAPR